MLNINSFYYSLISLFSSSLFGSILLLFFLKKDDSIFIIYAVISCTILSYLLWYFLIEKNKKYTYIRSILAGLLTITCTHIFSFYLTILTWFLCNKLTGGCLTSLKEAPANPIEGIYVSLFYGGLTLIFFIGWFSLPIGVVISLIYMKRIKKLLVK